MDDLLDVDGYPEGGEEDEFMGNLDDEPATQEDAWVVIDKYFDAKGLVAQQIDSFDEFILVTIQEMIDDQGEIIVTPQEQFIPGQTAEMYSYCIKFNQVFISKPAIFEADGDIREMFPHEARLRSRTYCAPMFIEIEYKQYQLNDKQQYDPINDEPTYHEQLPDKVLLAYVPVMLKSRCCLIHGLKDIDLAKVGECVFDQGGYFVINGSEKVIIAQERMSNNHVYVFKKQQPSKFEWVCETRSHVTKGKRPTSTMFMQMYGVGARNAIDGHQIRSTLPYIRTEVPVVIIFRAYGLNADKDVIEHIVYDFQDSEMMERFRPSLEEAAPIQSQEVALDYIGKRGGAQNVGRRERIQYVLNVLM